MATTMVLMDISLKTGQPIWLDLPPHRQHKAHPLRLLETTSQRQNDHNRADYDAVDAKWLEIVVADVSQ